MKILVTGGLGFIGSNFIRYVLGEHEDTIVNMDAETYAANPQNLGFISGIEGSQTGRQYSSRYVYWKGDICDQSMVHELLMTYRPDVIVHFAAESHTSRSIHDPVCFVRTNVLGTQVLLEEVRRIGGIHFHHVSTDEVFGELPLDRDMKFNEFSRYRPRSPYAASKAGADHLVRAYHETYGLPVTISNCCNNYGRFQMPEKVIPRFIVAAIQDKPLTLYTNSHYRREWLHVWDHCTAVYRILEEGEIGKTYLVGSGEERSIEDVANKVLQLLSKPSSLKTYIQDRPAHDRRYAVSSARIREELGWSPVYTFDDGMALVVDWYLNNREWWEQAQKRVGAEWLSRIEERDGEGERK